MKDLNLDIYILRENWEEEFISYSHEEDELMLPDFLDSETDDLL